MKIMVTGGTHGMGKGVAQALAGAKDAGHEIILLCRSKETGEATLREWEGLQGKAKISLLICDLSKLSDVRKAIAEILAQHSFLDAIFVNAGLGYAAKRVVTEDGMDPHFQVNYLSQFMLTLHMLPLLEKSEEGGRVIFNVTRWGKINWDDLQMEKDWSYVKGIQQSMMAKRMFVQSLHRAYQNQPNAKLSFYGFQIHKTVWTNQINIIPAFMRTMARMMKAFGNFISIEKCGEIMAPLFTEDQQESLKRSGKLISWKKAEFIELAEEESCLNTDSQDRLWRLSLDLCNDAETRILAEQRIKI